MKTVRHFLLALCAMLMLWVPQGHAEDIDIYSGGAANTGLPNVLIVLDNAANFEAASAACAYLNDPSTVANETLTTPTLSGTAGGVEQCALHNVIVGLAENTINLGMMVYNATNILDIKNLNCGGTEGGCLVQQLLPMTGKFKSAFLAWIRSWRTTGGAGDGYIRANGEATGAVMQEAWAYYAGKTGLSGRNYSGIKPVAGCQKNFVIFIGNAFNVSGTPGDGGNESPENALLGLYSGAGAGKNASPAATNLQKVNITIPSGTYGVPASTTETGFSCSPSYTMPNHTKPSGLYADEWARYMKETDLFGTLDESQGITTYTVGLLGPSCQPDYPALMNSMATVGGGKYFPTSNYSELEKIIANILNEIQAVNSVFASASLPVSVNAEGTFLNQIFLGMFRPDASASPRWVGNLKQFQLVRTPKGSSTGPLVMGDALGDAAISKAGTGFISSTAVSIWTYRSDTAAASGYFVNNPQGTTSTLADQAFDSPDGEVVEKGGTAQQVRKAVLAATYPASPAASTPSTDTDLLRRIYTYCPSGASCNAALSHSTNLFSVRNAAVLSSTASLSPSTITRAGTVATMTTPAAHGFIVNDQVTVSGAGQSEYNGNKTVILVPSTTTFTFVVPEYPPSPASGSYTVALPNAPQPLATLTRVGSTVTATTLVAHGYNDLDQITVGGANQSGYNGTFSIDLIDANRFSFLVVQTPKSPAGSFVANEAKATLGASSFSIDLVASNGVSRSVGGLTVTVRTTAAHSFANNNNVTLSDVKDASGALIAEYNRTVKISGVSGPAESRLSFTFDLAASDLGPASPATGTITVDRATTSQPIATLTRVGSTATATTGTTPTTLVAHGFSNGDLVNVSGAAGANESAYIKSSVAIFNTTVFTFDYTVTTTPVTSATGTITVNKVGVSDRTALINWVRGQDNYDDESGPGGTVTVRPSVHGDVLHSRPVVINYGDSRGLVVYYGSNDGVFRAVNGNSPVAVPPGGSVPGPASSSVPPGGELWGLVLREHYDKLNRQRVNLPELKIPPSAPVDAKPKDYFVDGSAGVFQQLDSNGLIDKAFLYLTMRRGGRLIYALDVSDPANPLFMWKKSEADFPELGQSWSRPRVTLVNGYVKPVLVFGAGYDPAEDQEPPGTPTARSMGRGIFILDATTGNRVWQATYGASAGCTTVAAVGLVPSYAQCTTPEMKYSIPSEVAFKDRDTDGFTDRIYVGDMGGNIWRVDLVTSSDGTAAGKSSAPADWRVTNLAALGCPSGACGGVVTPRKFFFPPSVISVGATAAAGSYEAVVIGSGDREHPLISNVTGSAHLVENRFYMIKDVVTTTNPMRSTTLPKIKKSASDEFTTVTESALFQAFKSATLDSHFRPVLDVMRITTTAAHGFLVGQTVVIDAANPPSLDGQFAITAVPTSTTFEFASTGASSTSAGATGQATVSQSKAAALFTFERAAVDVMTVTTTLPHNFLKGQTVVISGANPSSLNGSFVIASIPSTTTFTFALTGAITVSAVASGDANVAVAFDSTRTEPGFYGYLARGEKAVNAPATVSGTAFFGTNRPIAPSLNTCTTNLGQARGYAFSPFSAAFSSVIYDGGGLPPSPVAGTVIIENADGTESLVRFCIGCGGGTPGGGGGGANSPLENTDPFLTVPKKPQRTYWYRR